MAALVCDNGSGMVKVGAAGGAWGSALRCLGPPLTMRQAAPTAPHACQRRKTAVLGLLCRPDLPETTPPGLSSPALWAGPATLV